MEYSGLLLSEINHHFLSELFQHCCDALRLQMRHHLLVSAQHQKLAMRRSKRFRRQLVSITHIQEQFVSHCFVIENTPSLSVIAIITSPFVISPAI